MNIRPAELSDLHTLAELNQQLIWDEGHRNRMTLADLEARIRDWLQDDYQAHVFELDDIVVGYVLCRREDEWVYIRQFFIRPGYRRHGHGRFAFVWLVENTWQHAPRLRLDVLVNNEAGLAFWRSLGFADYCLTLERE